MRIYTRAGDDGSTGLFGGTRVSKQDPRLEAYGTLDELNAVLGLLRQHVHPAAASGDVLARIQGDLFRLGALLATPNEQRGLLDARMKRPFWKLDAMEADIDRLMALAPPLETFVLPGGSLGASWAHLARTVCRRAERRVAVLSGPGDLDPLVLCYLNRLSDWFFALARAENALAGLADQAWEP